jgi:ABC-type sugar transport system permease subunit
MASTTIASQTKRSSPGQAIAAFFRDQTKWTPYLFIAPFFLTFAVFTLYPMLRAVLMAFQEKVGFTGLDWEWVGFANFIEAITDDPRMLINFKGEVLRIFGLEIAMPIWFGTAFKNFIFYTLGSLATQLPIGFLLAWLLTSRPLKAKGFFRTVFFIPSVLPGVTMGVVGAWFFHQNRGFFNEVLLWLGVLQTRIEWTNYPRYIMPMLLTVAFWQYMGNHAIFMIAGMSGIDEEILEASVVDGANGWQRARFIILPMLKPVFAYISITAAAGSLMAYEVPYVLLGTSGGARGKGWFFIPYIQQTAFDYQRWGYATAIGWLVFLIAILITVLQFRLYDFHLGKSEA